MHCKGNSFQPLPIAHDHLWYLEHRIMGLIVSFAFGLNSPTTLIPQNRTWITTGVLSVHFTVSRSFLASLINPATLPEFSLPSQMNADQAAEMRFLWRLAGLSLRDRVKRTVICHSSTLKWVSWGGSGCLLGEVFWICSTGRRPGVDPRYAGEITSV